jgi:hypothetical protein
VGGVGWLSLGGGGGEGELMCDLLLCGICFMTGSNMGLCISVFVLSFICSFCELRLFMRKHFHVCNRGPFYQCAVYPLFSLLYHVCFVSDMCHANLAFSLLVFIACLCSSKCGKDFCLFALRILMDSYCILVGKCHFC